MTWAAEAALRARSDAILLRLFRLGEVERRIILCGLTDAQRAELAARRFGFEEERTPIAVQGREDDGA